jgi:uncharacterized repeat protein (TIGR01451 family)
MNVLEQLITSRAAAKADAVAVAIPKLPMPALARRLIKNTVVSLAAVTLSAATWAACSGVNLDVGYDFDLGAKTGIAPADAGTCVAGSTSAPAGDDYCAGNTTGVATGDYVIRTADSGVATLKYTFNAGTSHTDYVIVVDIPQTGGPGATSTRAPGLDIATWTGLPSACSGPTSSITNGGRRLTCDLGTIDRSASGQITVAVPAPFKVSSRALNGETFRVAATQKSSGGTTGACAVTPADIVAPVLTVSARPKIDIKTSAYTFSPVTRFGSPGYDVSYFVYVDGLNGATVGGEAVASPLSFNVGLSANIPTPGVRFIQVADYYGNTTDLTTAAVLGDPAGNGTLIPVTLTPNPTSPNCAAEFLIPGGACQETPLGNPQRLSTHFITYFVPISAFGAASQINFNNFINSDGAATGTPISTPPASGIGTFSEPITDNNAPYTIVKVLPGSYVKYTAEFVETRTERPPGSPSGNPQTMNEPVFTWCVSGACKQYPSKNVESLIYLQNRGSTEWNTTNGFNGAGAIVCDKFDNRGMVLTRKPRSPGSASFEFPTNDAGDPIAATRIYQQAGNMPSGYTVEVATAPGTPVGGGYPADSLNCGNADASWVSSAGITDFSPYNLVRIKAPVVKTPFDPGSDGNIAIVFFFTVPATAPNGAYIGNQLRVQSPEDFSGSGAGPGSWSTGVFDPLTNIGVYNGERFQVVKALVRTGKEAFDRFGNPTTIIGAGKTVTYQLTPSYTAAPGVPSPNSNISVVDVLPLPLTYVVGTARAGTPSVSLEPNTITVDGLGRQVLTWVLPNVVLNSAIPPIYFDVTAPAVLQSGTVLTNNVTVAAPLVDQSTDAERSANKALTVDNVAGLFVNKSVSTPLIPRNGTYSFTLDVGNLKSTVESNIDIIDVLPRSGAVNTSPVSAFSGTNVLASAITPPAGGVVYYTNAAPGAAPIALHSVTAGSNATAVAADYSIAATAANGWCTAAQISTPGCPATFAAATAFRLQIPTIAGNALVQVTVPMATNGNVENNTYVNRFSAQGATLPALFSNDVLTTVKQARLSGKVFVDSNLNSQPTAGEPSIPGVTITLTGTDSNGNAVTKTTVTDGSGNYEFTDLFPGTYAVTETQPPAYGSAGANLPGSAGGSVPSPDSFTAIPLVVGQNATNYNFGEIGSTLAGKVCEDLNNDGKCQPGEPPIAGVLITLTGTDSGGKAITRTATTTATGDWKIADLPNPDSTGYTLTETQPTAYLDGRQSPGVLTPIAGVDPGANIGTTAATTPGNDAITGIKFTQGTNGTLFDFAEVKPASLQGFVYYDLNKDGTRTTGELGIIGVTVELTGTNDLGQPVALTTTTTVSPDGSYTFSNLRPGNYTVREIQPTTPAFTVVDGTVTVGSVAYTTPPVAPAANNGTLITETPSTTSGAGEGVSGIVLGSGGVGTNYNFGEVPLVPISGTVFLDKSLDGNLTPGETGLPNSKTTTLTLCAQPTNPCVGADIIAVTTTTPGSGTYTFAPVPSGTYYVVEDQPTGYASSSPNIQPVTAVQTPITDVNFAETGAKISGTVYADNNADGALQVGSDTGIPGATLKLCLTSSLPACVSPIATTTTSSPAGTYTFADIPAPPAGETYSILEDESLAPLTTYTNGTTTVGTLTGGTAMVNGTAPPAEQGPAYGGNSTVRGISFVMPTAIITGTTPVVGTNYNFGELPVAGVSGRVFVDRDFTNGTTGTYNPATDGPLVNSGTTTVTLCSVDPSATGGICPVASVVATTVTAADGTYSFPVVPTGNFWVIEAQPVGYGSSSPNVVPVTRTGTTPVTNVNFADTLAEIKGKVYRDDDASGTFTPAEVGIGNVTVKLCLSTDPTCATPVATTLTTPTSGTYTFADLLAPPAGASYFIKEEQSTVPATLQNGTTTVGSLVVGTAPGTPVGAANSTNNTINNISWTPSATVVNAPQAVGTEYNFGELPISNISGRVFVDRDFTNGTTGTYNPATDGTLLNGATTTITLCSADPAANGGVCPAASVVGTTATAADGTYNFVNVPPGNYWVIESQPQGYGSSSPNVVPVTRTGTTPVSNINFADTLAEIKGTVYRDDNASGTLTPGEPGIGAVTVKLCLSTDPLCTSPVQTTTTTAISGTYTFANVVAPAPGTTYFIKEEQSTVPSTLLNGTTTVGSLAVGGGAAAPVGTADTPNSVISNVTWTPSTTLVNGLSALGTNYNFGELPVTTISGAVILDRDANGALTPGESGLPVTTTVTLCRSAPAHGQACPPADVVSVTTTTPGSGTYTFSGVTPGTYYVVETQPVGYGSSSPNTSTPINASTTPINGVNFYETGAVVSGTVYKDVDYSGAFNAGDTPLQNVTVRLCTTNNCAAGSVIATTTTNGAGLYQFTDVVAPIAGRPYFIVEDQATVPPTPTILGDGTSTVGAFTLGAGATNGVSTVVQTPSRFENLTWTPATSVVTGTAGVVATNFNFGEILGFDVSGKVFFDKNRNGALDTPADSGLQGVVITLCRVSSVPCTGTDIVATTTTSVTGDYSFAKVPPGSYFMQEAQPLGYGSVPTTTAPSVTDVRPFTVATGVVTGIDFADTLSSIAGLVYRDDNGSMTRDGTEPTMPGGITITLTGVDATGAAVTRTVVTSATGSYVFDNLKTGTYTITESQPAGFGTGGSNPGTLAGGTGGPNSNTITNVILPANTDAPNYNFGDTPKTAGVAGTVWRDNDHDNQRDADEPVLPGWTVQVLRTPPGGGTPTVVANAVTDAAGAYSITGLEAGGGYSVRFIAPGGAIFGGAVDGEQGAPVSGATVARGEITNLTLTASVTGGPNVIPQQSLPVDPSGVVYDSDTRLPVAGAQVAFQPVNCPTFNPAIHLVGGAANMTQTVGPDGFYQFLLNAGAPACEYRLAVTPPGQYIADPAIPPQPGPFTPPNRPPNDVLQIVPNATAPLEGQPTTYYMSFNLNDNSRDIVNNHIPLVSKNRPVLFITKVANKTKVELGDTVKYTVKVRYASGAVNLPLLKVVDTMPAGFKLIPETSYVSVPAGSPPVLLAASNIAGAPGSVVTYNIPLPAAGFAPGSEIELSYRVRVAVGSMQGDGINRAQARSVGTVRSNIAQAKVIVDPGVFTNDGCVAGKVFVDCNNNHVQDAEEIGIPGVKLYTEDGTYFVTDSEGKYSYCGLSPKSHVITVDMLTMPRGSRMTTTSNRNLGDGNSIYLDMKNGQLIRADFAEGSCSNTVLEQTKSRRAQGEVRSVETEKTGQPALKWEGKSPQYPQQGTDSANQPLVVPRTSNGGTSSVPEQNTPVPQMPGASSNTQGANLRNAK